MDYSQSEYLPENSPTLPTDLIQYIIRIKESQDAQCQYGIMDSYQYGLHLLTLNTCYFANVLNVRQIISKKVQKLGINIKKKPTLYSP